MISPYTVMLGLESALHKAEGLLWN